MLASIALSLLVLPFVSAQNTALELQAIEAHFTQSRLVPDLLAAFEPTALLDINYTGVGDITPGQGLTPEQSSAVPALTLTPGGTTGFNGTYTVAMVDADPVGQEGGQTRHWLVNGATVATTAPYLISTTGAAEITAYGGPGPAEGSGVHRYAILVYAQPETFAAPEGVNAPGTPIGRMQWSEYVTSTGLTLVAGGYITVEVGTSTVTASPTAAVVTSTLPAAAQSSPTAPVASGSASRSGAATPSASANAGVRQTIGFGGLALATLLGMVVA